ncbi:putative transcriptional regulator, LuxR-family [Cupriavidus taiwanensis]|uniref:LuxR C-terminal-related transcriptional regulator n=1 Tax=Cupriavidus taiwanensis TaxID=164546 RepID=UPI000E15C351|nr:LuxR C-terminal-related transcriptional regulator [Cupriavidus taiwanensis]SPA39659.1 putative transcriptional regulator, LuxR-family [Cupriavidus taiwanensis]
MSLPARILPKIVPPRTGSGATLRPRLIRKLHAAGDRKLFLLTAGAGFGKTTLMAQWHHHLEQAGARVLWVTLAAGDGALPQFCAILESALSRSGVPARPVEVAVTDDSPRDSDPATAVLDALAQTPGESYLMIDNFHQVGDPATVHLVQAMADAMLPGLHLVIASRTRPALRLGRLLAMEEVVVIGGAELLFNLEETAAFLRARPDAHLGPESARHVHDITDGWPVGVRLASRAMCSQLPDRNAARTCVCNSENLDAYLSEEVIDELSPALLDFVLRVSVLQCFHADLAACVTECADAARYLTEILSRHMFLLPVERRDGEHWYRFHPIFRAYLDKRRDRDDIDARPLHLRAAHWFMQHGRFAEAMRSAVLSDDFGLVTQLVDRALPPPHSLAQLGVFSRWLERIGCERLAGYPRLLYMGAWSFALSGRHGLAEEWLRSAQRSCSTRANAVTARHVQLLRALIATHRDDDADALAALQGLQAGETTPASGALQDIELALRMRWLSMQGQHLRARELYLSPAAGSTHTGRGELALLAAATAAGVAMREGDVREAERIGGMALHRARTIHGGRSLCAVACAAVTAQAWYELDRIDEAREALLYCRTTLRAASIDLKLRAAQVFGRITALRDSPQDAMAYFGKAEAHFRAIGADRGVMCMLAEQQRIVLSYGDWRHAQCLQKALDEIVGGRVDTGTHTIEIRAVADLGRARLMLARGLAQEALGALDTARPFIDAMGSGRLLAVSDFQQARALEAMGCKAEAYACVQSALAACYRLGLHRTLLEEGAGLHERLLRAGMEGGAALEGYVRGLVGEPAAPEKAGMSGSLLPGEVNDQGECEVKDDMLIPALTRREMEVLTLLEQSMSNKRIALTLSISVQTVKWNLKKIFVKLQVTSRYEAIVAARKLALCVR